jgi:hypothetical protein
MARIITPRAPRIGVIKGVGPTGDAGMDSVLAGEIERRKRFATPSDSAKVVNHRGPSNPFAGLVGMVKSKIQDLAGGPENPDTSAIDAQIANRKQRNAGIRFGRKMGI